MPIYKIEQLVKQPLFKAGMEETETVTVTATMKHGSALVGTAEAAIADVATIDGLINFPNWDDEGYQVGDVITVNVAKRGVIVDASVVNFSDAGSLVPASATALAAATVLFV